jgi:hypothetical protein
MTKKLPRTISAILESAGKHGPARPRGPVGPSGPAEYDLDWLNENYAFVIVGTVGLVMRENQAGTLEDRLQFLKVATFKDLLRNRPTEVTVGGKSKVITWADRWLADPGRRTYEGIQFHPDAGMGGGMPGYLNLWRGYSVIPAQGCGKYTVFKDHVFNNVCRGDQKLFDFVFGFFANLVQKPREKPGVALVLRGAMGSGKTIVGEIFGSLISRHYVLADDPRYITGRFNVHQSSCLLLQADEAVWAGDKAAEGRLKGLITSSHQQIEAKGVDPITLPNYVRVIMTSNEDWVVPAGKDERRFCVLDVDPRCAQNHEYFAEMQQELDEGGREALLADLLAYDLSKINLRQIPRTSGLLQQKILSFTHIEAWWFERLLQGAQTRRDTHWRDVVPKTGLHDDYLAVSEQTGVKRRSTETELGMTLKRLVPGLKDTRPWINASDGSTRRQRCWEFPALDVCREAFAELLQQSIDWPVIEEDTARATAASAE